jgi:hypothetical protein
MNTRPTPETDKFFATFADGEAAPSHAEYYARLQDLERERDEAREALKTGGMLNIIDRAAHDRAAAIRERDEARAETIRTREFMDYGFAKAQEELTDMTAQRDRLAGALRYFREDSAELLGERDWWQSEPRCDYAKRWQETHDNLTRADEALQSLTPKAEP